MGVWVLKFERLKEIASIWLCLRVLGRLFKWHFAEWYFDSLLYSYLMFLQTAKVQWGSCAKNPVSTLLEKTNVFDCTVFGFKWNRPKVTAQLKQDNWSPLWPWENDNAIWTSFYTTRGLPTTIPSFFTETIALSKMILISSFSKLSMQKPPCAKTSV